MTSPRARRLCLIQALFIFVSLLCQARGALAQATDNHLTVIGDAIEEVAADQAILSVNLTYNDEKDITLVYEQHKVGLERLTGLLNELKVPEKDLQIFQLLVRKERDFSMAGGSMGQPVEKFKGYQRITLKFTNLQRYAQVQQRLASDGFNDLTTAFSVSNQRDIELRLAEQAVARAKEKADRLAKVVSRSIKRIVRIGDVEETEPIGFMRANLTNAYANSYTAEPMRSGVTVPQTFRYSAFVKVVFELN